MYQGVISMNDEERIAKLLKVVELQEEALRQSQAHIEILEAELRSLKASTSTGPRIFSDKEDCDEP